MNKHDIILIGGGIVGVATALELKKQFPSARICLIEKENKIATHQTGHNSGVIHAGVYYKHGSLKAKFCRQGSAETIDFCKKYKIPFRQCGKLLVATNQIEASRLENIKKICSQNRIDFHELNHQDLKKKEPHITGKKALFVPESAITDYKAITCRMAQNFQNLGGTITLNQKIIKIHEKETKVIIKTPVETFQASYVIACAGLWSDMIARMMGINIDFMIIPFRGEYYVLPPSKSQIVKHLIYPVPNPELPFLGVHLTPMIDGRITLGPNAVLGYKKEGYGKINFSLSDTARMIVFPGFKKMIGANLKSGLAELKNSIYKAGYLKQVQKYSPGVHLDDMSPYPAGIRAQAVKKDGTMVHDFLFKKTPRSFHVCNAPSPAATSAIPIARYLQEQVRKHFKF